MIVGFRAIGIDSMHCTTYHVRCGVTICSISCFLRKETLSAALKCRPDETHAGKEAGRREPGHATASVLL